MSELFDLLGKDMADDEVKKTLALYPGLRPEIDEPEPGDDSPPLRYLRSERDGLLVKLSADGELLAVFLMSEGKDGFRQFRGPLPAQLTFDATAADVLRALGAPAYSRPPAKLGSLHVGELLRFDRPTHSVHFQFRSGQAGIDLVSAMAARAVPGRSVRL
jgi:hypothetical protein